jgi:hypothetical protein
VSEATTPDEFDPIFRQGVLVVGGHAVNLWGSYYAGRGDPRLQMFAPFISKDGDVFVRDKELARAVAASAGWKFRDNPEARSPVLGHIYLTQKNGELRVDVLRSVTGLTDEDLSFTAELQFSEGRTYLLPAPHILLKAKLANLAEHNQEDRQDARHVQIMVACNRQYLLDAHAAVRSGAMTERDAVDYFMDALRVIRGPRSSRMDRQHDLRLASCIPSRSEIVGLEAMPRLLAFYTHQLNVSRGVRP